jgi:molybdopterin-containing oxidoreductase family iron-sulfur binding subunit
MSHESFVPLHDLSRRPGGRRSSRFWKSLDELAETPAFLEFLHREFPSQASEWSDPKGRREFLRMMGASFALAGLTACTRPPNDKIVPYVKPPEEVVPGKPLFFATALCLGGFAKGVLVESHLGRPTKIEGNPDHPGSRGATDAISQAEILSLYDPDRSKTVEYMGEVRPWSNFLAEMKRIVDVQTALKGAGVRILTGSVTSPTLAHQIDEILAALPLAQWHTWEPVNRDNVLGGAALAFSEPAEVLYHFDKADVVLSLDGDFMSRGPAALAQTRDLVSRRNPDGALSRLYAVESTPSIEGAVADHRLPLRFSEVEAFTRALGAALGAPVSQAPSYPPDSLEARWIGALAKDLKEHRGTCLVVPGADQPPNVHALALGINSLLGNFGTTLTFIPPVEERPGGQLASLKELVADMGAGKVDLLLMLGGNPVYDAPADFDFVAAMNKVAARVHLSLYQDETTEHCHWHIPQAHSLETWSDARAFDGTATILQPLIAPLYGGKSAHEVLATLTKRPERSSHDLVKEFWSTRLVPVGGGPDHAWQKALHDGFVPGTASPEKRPPLRDEVWKTQGPPKGEGLEIVFRADPSIHDGRYSNNGWLQELPKPLTKLTWDNAAFLSPKTARALGLEPQDTVDLVLDGRSVAAGVWVLAGHADDSVTVHLGYGRTRAGRIGTGTGFNAYALRTSAHLSAAGGLQVRKRGERTILATTQDHWTMDPLGMAEERRRFPEILRTGTLAEYRGNPTFARDEEGEAPSLLPKEHTYPGHAWGLVVDLNSCVGCNACVVACQAENNIPVVGKEQVLRGREMHWIRVDRYYGGDPGASESIETHHQPLLCMQCEDAPCEQVCPVAATVHSDEGLNDQVYNRCVGTRYCSNNCPYKVRRFNFLQFQDWETPSYKLMRNPNVTVRSRGVMEKCTYCVQRINAARIEASNAGRPIGPDEIKTACQQSCPASAIVFGDINDTGSAVSAWRSSPRNYAVLGELGTKPRTTYLASVRNPNPELAHG